VVEKEAVARVRSTSSAAIEVRPLDAAVGAEVRGWRFDRRLDDETRRQLLAALALHGLLVLRGHDKPPDNRVFRDFGLRLGPLRPSVANLSRLRDHEEINLVSNTVEADGVTGTGGTEVIDWHADMNFETPATDYIVLDALELPSSGGATRFANLHAAYDDLPPAMKERIEHLEVRYRFKQELEYAKLSPEHLASLREVTYTLVQCRFPSFRRSMWPNVGIFDGTIVGIGAAAGQELLAELFARATEERFVYEHQWQEGDCAVWSNWSVFHRREPFDASQRRVMRHLTVSEGGPRIDAEDAKP
jgi:taurine dioxygenase